MRCTASMASGTVVPSIWKLRTLAGHQQPVAPPCCAVRRRVLEAPARRTAAESARGVDLDSLWLAIDAASPPAPQATRRACQQRLNQPGGLQFCADLQAHRGRPTAAQLVLEHFPHCMGQLDVISAAQTRATSSHEVCDAYCLPAVYVGAPHSR